MTLGAVSDADSQNNANAAHGPVGSVDSVQRLFLRSAAALLVIACTAVWPMALGSYFPGTRLTQFYFLWQDSFLLGIVAFALLILPALPLLGRLPQLSLKAVAVAVLALGVACYAGHYFLLGGADLTNDEQLANFDAYIFDHGRLFWNVPTEWRAEAEALNLNFMLPVSGNAGWVSSYLPMNAALRAIAGLLGDPSLASPLLVVLGAYSLFKICRILWPGDDEATIVALALYVLSGQIVFTGMTAYAMTGHLALNLLWLWLFLMRKPAADLGAIAVGFVATGLHQPVFHPLFAIAFLAPLVFERRFARAAFFAAGYAAIILFWLQWPSMISNLAGGGVSGGAVNFMDRFTHYWRGVSMVDVQTMAMNLVRLITWQHVLFAPLLALGILASVKGVASYGRSLLASLVLPIVAVTIILSYQGHGWGFRYLHGALGAGILLAVYGWKALKLSPTRRAGLLIAASAVTAFAMMPLQAFFIGSTYQTTAAFERKIENSGADYVIVSRTGAPFAADVVHNMPDLSNRPIRLLSYFVTDKMIRRICAGGAHIAYFGVDETKPLRTLYRVDTPGDEQDPVDVASAALKAGCTID